MAIAISILGGFIAGLIVGYFVAAWAMAGVIRAAWAKRPLPSVLTKPATPTHRGPSNAR